MKYIVWDLETDHSATDWCSILEIGCILLDSNFKEEQRFQARCRLPDDRVPTATALCINRTNVDLLTKSNLSHYQLINQIEKLFKFWSKDQPTTFIAYSGINFDSEVIRKEFFKSLKDPYIENTNGNQRHDALNVVRAAFALDEKILNSELNEKGNISMKLESLARLNGFDAKDSHSALVDTENTCNVLGLIKQKQPNLWNHYLKTASKQTVESIMKSENLFTVTEYFYGRSRLFLTAPLHPKNFNHPVYKWAQVVDLRFDCEKLFALSYSELKAKMKESPKFLRTIRSNKAPIILDPSYAMKVDPYNKLDPALLRKRAELIKNNEKFANDVCNILQENAEEKMQTQSQEDPEPEETIYTGFASPKDKFLFTKWHEADWKDKLAMLDKFEDNRHAYFGSRILFNEAPEILPKDMYKKIKRKVAERILSTNKEKWTTVNDFYVDCDNLREDDNKMFSFKTKDEKLKFLDGINDYVMNLELKYQDS